MMSYVMHHLFHRLVVHNGGEDHHDKCNELLGLQVRLRDRRKSICRRNSRVLLRKVGSKTGRVVARYDITTNILYHSFGYDIMLISMISDIMIYMISYETHDIIVLI